MTSSKTQNRIAKLQAGRPKATEALVAFIDLLGFSEQVLAVHSADGLERLVNSVSTIRDYFDYQPTDPITREAQEISKTEVLAFSDCVVVSIDLRSAVTETQGEFDVWGSDMVVMAYAQGKAAASGRFIRGGLDKGLWFHDGGILVSPALVRAYRLETNAAKFPVLAISDSLYVFLRDHPGRRVYSVDLDPFPSMFRSFTDASGKKVHYLNYMELMLDDMDWQYDKKTVEAYRAAEPEDRDDIVREGIRKSWERFLRDHRDGIQAAHQAADNDQVKSKYAFLRGYHNEIVDKYFKDRNDLKVAFANSRAKSRTIAKRS